jgi:psiF repeat
MLRRKSSCVFVLAMMAGAAVPGLAQDAAKQPSTAQAAQRQKMKDCNAQAGTYSLAGDERKKFMSQCLTAAGVSRAQQEKMKMCNQEATAKSLDGDDRKAFMSSCLNGSTR